jgi:general secretion pathway protein C
MITLAMLAALAAASAGAATPPLDLAAVGIVVSGGDRSVAVLRSGGRTRVVSVGETAFGGRVVAILAESVTLEYGAERHELRLVRSAPQAAPPPLPPAPQAPPEPPEDPTTPARAMARREVERRLSDEVPRILAETTLSPVTEDGRIVGLAVTRIAEGSLLTDAGLRAGDVLTRINDVTIDGLPTLIGLYSRLQNETELRAVVLRNGRPVSLSVTLR